MGIFTRTTKPVFASEPIKAAAGVAGTSDFMMYTGSWARQQAILIPTISRARDLIVSLVSSLPFQQYTNQWMGEEYEEIHLPGESWMSRPDPNVTRQFVLAWTADDILFHGRAFWAITSRSQATGLPLSFQWLPAADVQSDDMPGPLWYGKSNQLTFQGQPLITNDIIQFLSPVQGMLSMGARAIEISNRLDTAAMRFASNEITAGYLQQTNGSEPMSSEELGELCSAWSQARRRNAIGALNSSVTWHEFSSDPSKLQLVEARTHQMTELANLCNIPQYLVGAPVTGMTYSNAQQSRQDLYQFAAKPVIDCIGETLSAYALPRGREVRLDTSEYISESTDTSTVSSPDTNEMSNS